MEPRATSLPAWISRPAVWVFAGTFLLRLLVLSAFSGTPYFSQQMGDMKFYDAWAQRILSGQFSDGYAFYGLPGYAFLLAAVYRVVGVDFPLRYFSVSIFQAVVESATAVLLFKIATRLCENEKNPASENGRAAPLLGAVAALAWATFLPAQTFAVILMPTCWVICAYWFLVWLCLRLREKSPWRPWPALGALIGLMTVMVATINLVIPLLLVRIGLSVGAGRPWPRRAAQAVLAAVLLMAGVFAGSAPAWVHNYYYAHDPVLLSAHSGLNFWMGNSPGANGYPKIPAGLRPGQDGLLKDSILWAEKAAGHPLKRSEVSRYWSEKASRYMHEYPEAWGRLLLVKVRNFWNAFEYDDLSVMTLLRERGVLWPGLRWGFVAALGLVGVVTALVRGGPARWVAGAVLLHMAAILPVFITERYRLNAAPGLIILGVYVLRVLRDAVLEARWPLAGALSAGSLAAALFVSLPTRDPALLSLDPFNLGVKELAVAEPLLFGGSTAEQQALGQAELARAERHLAAAYALVQGDPGITFALGNLWLDKGRNDSAAAFYGRTLELNPHFTGALNNLGYLALEKGDFATAERLLVEAAKIEPENAKSHFHLARALEGLGKLGAARAEAAAAVRLEPKQKAFLELQERLRGAH